MHKITLNLDDTILQALKLKSSETKQSMAEVLNDFPKRESFLMNLLKTSKKQLGLETCRFMRTTKLIGSLFGTFSKVI
jgi:hypothetical protein